jgi:hypothetical protein
MKFLITSAAIAASIIFAPDARGAIVFSDDFNSGASPLWGNDIGAWTAAAGVYDASSPSNFPNAHSSLPFDLGDFTIEFDISNVSDGGVWLRSTLAPGTAIGRTGVLLVTGGSGGSGLYWHVVTNGNSYGSSLGVVGNLFTPGVSDPHLRVEVSGDTYSVFVNGLPAPSTTLTTTAFLSGQVALYDRSSQTFDNVVLSTPGAVVPEPASFIIWSVMAAGSAIFWRRSRRVAIPPPTIA